MKSSTSLAIAHVFTIILFRICYNGASQFQNIGQALGFYGVYHQDPINQLIHFVGVPIIIWSLQLFLVHLTLPPLPLIHHYIPKIKNLPFMPDHDMTYGTISTIGYILLYLKLDWFGGLLYAPFAYMLYATAVSTVARDQIQAQQQAAQQVAHQKTLKSQATNAKLDSRNTTSTGIDNTTCTSWTGTGQVLKMAFVLHFLGWYVQIHPGHAIFEGATPAAVSNLGGALTSAPLFAYYEGLWFLGLNRGLQQETLRLVEEYTRELCQDGADFRICANYL